VSSCDRQIKQERQAEIDRENKLLLQRLENVWTGHGQIDNWNRYKHHRYSRCRLHFIFTIMYTDMIESQEAYAYVEQGTLKNGESCNATDCVELKRYKGKTKR